MTRSAGAPELHPQFSICFTTSIPSTTLPKFTCFVSSRVQAAVVIKNWHPFELAPAFAMESMYGDLAVVEKKKSKQLESEALARPRAIPQR